jgi:hypothetical protein
MMSYKIETLTGEPVILLILTQDAAISEDMPKSGAEIRTLLDQASEPMFFIMDMSAMQISLDDLILGSNLGARGEQPLTRHPHLKEMLFVSSSKMVKLGLKGLNTLAFGNMKVKAFDTLDEALAYVHAQVTS